MKRTLAVAAIVVAAALIAWLIAGRNTAPESRTDSSVSGLPDQHTASRNTAAVPEKEAGRKQPHKPEKKQWKPNPAKPDPLPPPAPVSKKAMQMKPHEVSGWADERMGDFIACTNEIDECYSEAVKELEESGSSASGIVSENSAVLKKQFRMHVHNAIGYFEFVSRHKKRLDDDLIDTQEFYYRLERRSYLFEADPADILEMSVDDLIKQQDPDIERIKKEDIGNLIKTKSPPDS